MMRVDSEGPPPGSQWVGIPQEACKTRFIWREACLADSCEDVSAGPGTVTNHNWNIYQGTPNPPVATGSSTHELPNREGSSPTLLHKHRDAIFQSAWFRNNQAEPPIQPNDPLVRFGLLTPESSRFELFIHSTGEKYNCLYVEPGGTVTCPYSNLRRQRAKAHVLAHFSYKPFVCDGSCGKADW